MTPSRSALGAKEVWLQLLRDALLDHLLQAEVSTVGSQQSWKGTPSVSRSPHSRSEAWRSLNLARMAEEALG